MLVQRQLQSLLLGDPFPFAHYVKHYGTVNRSIRSPSILPNDLKLHFQRGL